MKTGVVAALKDGEAGRAQTRELYMRSRRAEGVPQVSRIPPWPRPGDGAGACSDPRHRLQVQWLPHLERQGGGAGSSRP